MCPTVRAMAEMWRPVLGHPGYEVAWDGRIRNARTKRVLKPQQAKSGRYAKVSLERREGRQAQAQVHQLVAEAWHGPKPMGMPQVVDHRDNDGRRNCATNLQWCTYSMNTRNYYAWQARELEYVAATGADELEPLTAAERADFEARWGREAVADYEARWGVEHAHRELRDMRGVA